MAKLEKCILRGEAGFTIIELLVVLGIVALLSTLITGGTVLARQRSRDTKRLADISQMQTALELYRANIQNSQVLAPSEYGEAEASGWDTTLINQNNAGPNWLDFLVDGGYVTHPPLDPYNNAQYYYRYQKFPAGSFGCASSFYILQVMQFEAATNNHGYGNCPNRDFIAENPDGFTVQIFE